MKTCPFCAEQIQDAAVVCRFCQRSLTAASSPPTVTIAAPTGRTWSPGVAAVLSVFIPGLGSIYKGHIGLGITLFVSTIIGYAAFIVPGIVLHILSIVHAYNGPSKDEVRAQRATAVTSARQPPPVTRTPIPRTPEQLEAEKRTVNRRFWILATGIVALLTLGVVGTILSEQSQTTRQRSQKAVPTKKVSTTCLPHVELLGTSFWAKELGQPESQVAANHTINLWEGPSPAKGRKVGALRVGSRAVILEETATDYRVRSPFDNSTGWVGKTQVARTLHQDTTNRLPCKP